MAMEQAQSSDFPVEAEPLDMLAYRLRRTQKLLLVFAALCTVSLLLGIAVLTLALRTGSQLDRAEYRFEESLAEQTLQMNKNAAQIIAAVEASAQIRTVLSELDSRIARLDINDQANVLVKVQRILIRQERDYRDFLTDLERGMHDIQKMIPHSRSWWDAYSEQMQESIRLSEARENYLMTLREN
jgi:hypothetical protein